jgi:uncharacterized membrane protein YbhN (UPF0104 family)
LVQSARRRLAIGAQVALGAAVVAYVVYKLAGQWASVREVAGSVTPHWTLLIVSALIVLATYVLLAETWRRTVAAWGSTLSFGDAARIWFISNLYRYLPLRVWAIGAMGVMAQRRGVSPAAATGSSLMINLVNVLAGFGVVLATGAQLVPQSAATVITIALLAILVVAAPRALPLLVRLASRMTGRALTLPALPARAIWLAAVASVISWLLYGIAFRIFVQGVLGTAAGAWSSYIAVYSASYLIGYIALFSPGGLLVREGFMVAFFGQLGLASEPNAIIIAAASRLWLTILEIIPGVFLLVRDSARRSFSTALDDGSSS